MLGKSKGIIAVLVGTMVLCLLSACTAYGYSADNESQEGNVSTEQEFGSEGNVSTEQKFGSEGNVSTEQGSSSESLPSETDDAGLQSAEEDKPVGMEESYRAILLGEGDFCDYNDKDRRINIENIKEVVTESEGVTAKVTKFTIIDLDGNGENEIVLWVEVNDHMDWGFVILYFQDQEVYGYPLWYRAFQDLKTDGTFYSSGGTGNRGIRRLKLSENGFTVEEVSDSEAESYASKPDVEWYDLTPENVELAFENMF